MLKTVNTALLGLLALTVTPQSLSSTEVIPVIYHQYAKSVGVPVDIWFALVKQESCLPTTAKNHCLPWPWTANIEGKSHRYKNKQQATAAIQLALGQGKSVDVGLGQLHYQSHYDNFIDVEHMISINENLAYSAKYLRQHYDSTGDWWEAVGRYHSPGNKQRAESYRQLVRSRWQRLQQGANSNV